MAKVETQLTPEQILDDMRQLSDKEQRALAAAVLNDQRLEAFVEELDDQLVCEKAAEEGLTEPFSSESFPVQ